MIKKRVTKRDALNLFNIKMPSAMSKWIEDNVFCNNIIEVRDNGRRGYLMKSEDCTVIIFPNCNCDNQVARISNKLNGKAIKY